MRRKLLKRRFGEGLDRSFLLITYNAGEREFIVGYTTQIQRRYCELRLERGPICALTSRISTRNASSPKLSETRHRSS